VDSASSNVSVEASVLKAITISPDVLNILTLASDTMTVTMSIPAVTGGQTISLMSDNPAVTVPSTVTVPFGMTSVTFVVTSGTTAGTAVISASADGFESGSGTVTVSARTMIVSASGPLVGVGRTIGGTVTLSQPAPEGGVTIDLASSNAGIATVSPATLVIAGGGSSASFDISGIAPGTVTITANASGYSQGSTSVTTTSSLISLGTIPTIAPDQNASLPVSLSTNAPIGGVTINFTSSNTAIATVTPSIFVPEGQRLPAGNNPQVIGVGIGTAQITATAIGFAQDTRSVVVTVTASFNPTSVSTVVTRTTNISLKLSAPAPAGGITFNLSSDDPLIATLPSTATIPAGESLVWIDVTGTGAGNTTLRASAAGINEATATVNVSAANITLNDLTLGKDLQASTHASLSAPAPTGGLEVTITSADPAKVLLSVNETSVGTQSITLNVAAGTSSTPSFYVQALDSSGSVQITVSASGYTSDSSSVTMRPSGFIIFTPGNFSTTTFAANTAIQIVSARLNPTTLAYETGQALRGGLTVQVPVTSSDTNVGTITVSPVTFTGGTVYYANTAFDPVIAGTSVISVSTPAGFSTPSNKQSITATVNP
jgi:hypothetical protein